jgi:hypothetical protein
VAFPLGQVRHLSYWHVHVLDLEPWLVLVPARCEQTVSAAAAARAEEAFALSMA